MISWADACKQAKYDPTIISPAPTYSWFAYKNGKCERFATQVEAKAFSKFIERTEDAVTKLQRDEFIEQQRTLMSAAAKIWYDALQEEYADYPINIFRICFEQAFNNAHAHGYDEVADNMKAVVEFATRILKGDTNAQ